MDPARSRRIKSIVRENFDLSPRHYSAFEERFGLFARLTRALAALADAGPGSRVVDMGCGTGDSTLVLAGLVGPDGLVVGLDISASMLRAAASRRPPPGSAPVCWILGDAEAPACLSGGCFDLVLYNASVFLLPDAAAGVARARELLAPGGRLGATVLRGLVDADTGERLAESQGAIADPDGLLRAFGPGARSTRTIVGASGDQARAFYAIPAQSSSLFPRRPLEERIERVHALFDRLEASGTRPGLEWDLVVSGGRG
jgi:SAM-dependent methyltransferase